MWVFYIGAFIPVIIGAVLHIKYPTIVWQEWAGASVVAFLLAMIFSVIAVAGRTRDTETWSGQILKAVHYPEWIEEYQVAIYKTVTHRRSDGSTYTTSEFSHYETRHRTHHEYWDAETDLDYSKNIDKKFFEEISNNFSNLTTETPHKSGFDSGDPNIYVAYNKTGYIYPVTDLRHFKNRVKAAPTVFSFPKVPESVKVFNWPENSNWLKSDRLLGTAKKTIDLLAFDRMNTHLGPRKKVNVIIVGFHKETSEIAHWQEAKWIGGKKNDLVLCYGGDNMYQPSWTYVFGWTEQEIVKRNLETLLLNNKVDISILLLIQEEIVKNYIIKDWSKFDYITIQPPTWSYIVYVVVVCISQAGFWYWAYNNEFRKRFAF